MNSHTPPSNDLALQCSEISWRVCVRVGILLGHLESRIVAFCRQNTEPLVVTRGSEEAYSYNRHSHGRGHWFGPSTTHQPHQALTDELPHCRTAACLSLCNPTVLRRRIEHVPAPHLRSAPSCASRKDKRIASSDAKFGGKAVERKSTCKAGYESRHIA